MGNVARILKRDVLRLFKAPAALIVAVALLVLPSLYTWYNVAAFWNPYEATGNLKVCVVNQDAGAKSDLAGEIDVGERVAEELLVIDKLNFVSEDLDEAMAGLEAGDVYAVYVIPSDFSECLISPLTGMIKKPTVEYYTNEKLGPVSPKITDTAASTLEETINSMFVKTVSDAAVKEIDEAFNSAAGNVTGARSVASARMNAVLDALTEVRNNLSDAQKATGEAQDKVGTAASSMNDVATIISDARNVVLDVEDEANALEERLMKVAEDASGALPEAIKKAAQVEAKVDGLAEDLSSLTKTGQNRMADATDRLQSAIKVLNSLASELEGIANALPEGWSSGGSSSGGINAGRDGWLVAGSIDLTAGGLEGGGFADGMDASAKSRLLAIASEFRDKANNLRTLVNEAKELDSQLSDLAQAASNTVSDLKGSAKQAADALQDYNDDLFGTTVQTIVSTLTQVDAACTRVSAALLGLDSTVGQVQSNMRQLSELLGDCGDALSKTDKLVGGVRDDMSSLASDVRLLADSGALADLLGGGNLNPQNISAFLGSPTKVEKVEFYHPNVYGTSMAPLFMNLTFWIGAFMLVIIFRLEVDDEGIKRVTFGQRYLSRFLLFSGFVVLQAIVCCIGTLVMGVQVANVPAFFFGSAVTALAYLSIIYALSTNLQHVGKALCIILVFAQIPGGSGLYPLELTSGFFQAIYPFLPFSYGIGALREAIFGFYGDYYLHNMLVLALMLVGMLVLGMLTLPLMSNVTRMAARQVNEGGLYNGEEAVVPARPYRLSQVMSALSDRDDYRERLQQRYNRFSRSYPIFIRASIVLGVGVPVALMFLLALDAGEKVLLLTIFLLWLIGLVVFLLVVESLRYSFERQLNIDRMSDNRLVKIFFDRDRMQPALDRIEDGATDAVEEANGEAEELSSAEAHDEAEELDDAEAHDEADISQDADEASGMEEERRDEPEEPHSVVEEPCDAEGEPSEELNGEPEESHDVEESCDAEEGLGGESEEPSDAEEGLHDEVEALSAEEELRGEPDEPHDAEEARDA